MHGAGLASGGGGIVARLAMFARVWEFKLDVLEDGGDGPGGCPSHVFILKFKEGVSRHFLKRGQTKQTTYAGHQNLQVWKRRLD